MEQTPARDGKVIPRALIVGTPVVFLSDNKKIKDAALYNGSTKLGKTDDVDLYGLDKLIMFSGEAYVRPIVYSPTVTLAAEVGMIDYIPEQHKKQFKYIVISDIEKSTFIENYQDEYGDIKSCHFMSLTDFFMSLCQTNFEQYFTKKNRPIHSLPLDAEIFISPSYTNSESMYDDAKEIGLNPIYDLVGKEGYFKYIVCKGEEFVKYEDHLCELIIGSEFEVLVDYTKWIRNVG